MDRHKFADFGDFEPTSLLAILLIRTFSGLAREELTAVLAAGGQSKVPNLDSQVEIDFWMRKNLRISEVIRSERQESDIAIAHFLPSREVRPIVRPENEYNSIVRLQMS